MNVAANGRAVAAKAAGKAPGSAAGAGAGAGAAPGVGAGARAAAAIARAARLHARVAFTGKRLAVPIVVAMLIAGGGLAARLAGTRPIRAFDLGVEWGWLLLLPAVAGLVLAAGAWGLEIEARTLTYLLLRPVRRAYLYLGKVLAVGALLAVLGVAGTVALYLGTWGGSAADLAAGTAYLARAAAAAALAGMGYAALLGFFGVAAGARAFLAAGSYVLGMEWLVARSALTLRWATLSFHLRILAGVGERSPGASAALSAACLVALTAACLAAGMLLAGRREH